MTSRFGPDSPLARVRTPRLASVPLRVAQFLSLSRLLALLLGPPLGLGCATAPREPDAPPNDENSRPSPLGFTDLEGPHAIYFVLVDRFVDGAPNLPDVVAGAPGRFQGGDLSGVLSRLDSLRDLGIDTIWLSPLALQVDTVLPSKDDDGKPFEHAGFHGYWAEDLAALDPHFGDRATLDRLLDEAHRRGMRVILDVVVNHLGYGATATEQPRSATSLTRGCTLAVEGAAEDPITQCLFGLPDLRTEDPTVQTAVVDAAASWFERHPFDGIRFDTLKHAEPVVFARVRSRAEAAHRKRVGDPGSNLLAVGEWWGASPHDDTLARLRTAAAGPAVDTLLDFSFSELAVGFAAGRVRAEALMHHLARRHAAPGPPYAHFLSSHDTPPLAWMLRGTPQRAGLAATLQMTTRGIPVTPWGEEAGRPGGPWPHNRKMFDTDVDDETAPSRQRKVWRSLLRARALSPGLRSRAFQPVFATTTDAGATLVYVRGVGADAAIVALARGPATTIEVDIPAVVAGSSAWTRCAGSGTAGALSVAGGTLRIAISADSADVWSQKECAF